VTAPDPEDLLALAAETAAAAGHLLADRGALTRPEVVETKSSLTDVVTEMDRQAEALITERIRAARPGDAILGEEGGETHGATPATDGSALPEDAVRWIVDPLDGTVNYLYGLADWAVSIAAEVDGTIVAGVVAIPLHGETFLAIRGRGARLRNDVGLHSATETRATETRATETRAAGETVATFVTGATGETRAAGVIRATKGDLRTRESRAIREPWPAGETGAPLRCNPDVPLARALVGTGFGYLPGRRRVQGEVVSALLPQIRDIRRGGSASVDLCMVAAGRLDAFYERGLNYWDWAAGALIAEEAGARVTGLNGRPPSPSMTVAAAAGLHGELIAALTPLDPERDA
jgi:myo-inositol-1(or 4)-monophosphatase